MSAYKELKTDSKPGEELVAALMQFNYWIPSYDYSKDITPLEGVFYLLFSLAQDKRKLFDFWNDKKEEIENLDKYSDLSIPIKRWLSVKSISKGIFKQRVIPYLQKKSVSCLLYY